MDASGIVPTSATSPSNASNGDLWFDTTDATLNFYHNDGSSSQWVSVSGPAGPAGPAGTSPSFSALDSNLVPVTDSSLDLGSPTKKWKDLYLSGSTIHLGDTQLKGSGGRLTIADSTGTVVNPFNVAPRFSTVPPANPKIG